MVVAGDAWNTGGVLTWSLAAVVEESHNELPVPPWVIGVGTLALLITLLMITSQFNRDR